MKKRMIKILMAIVMGTLLFAEAALAQNPQTEQRFDQTDGVLARARAVEDIEYKIMVQRATQAAIYYMPAVVMVDFVKAIPVIWVETSTM